MEEKKYEVDVPRFKFRGEQKMKGDIVSMTEEEFSFFSVYVKPYKKVTTTKDLGGLVKGGKK